MTSFSKTLSSTPIQAESLRQTFLKAAQGHVPEKQISQMVAQDRRQPQLRPGPALAGAVDRDAYNARLAKEHAAFKAKRQARKNQNRQTHISR